MKPWIRFHDQYCWEFLVFAENTLDSSAIDDILQNISERGNGSGVHISDYQSLDREGGNYEIVGHITQGDREYGFRVRDGNWNGTEVIEFGEDEYFSLSCWRD